MVTKKKNIYNCYRVKTDKQQIISLIIKFLIIVIVWVIVCTNPWLLFPFFFFLPLIKIYLVLGLINGFEDHEDKRKHNRFKSSLTNEFIAGATVTNTINNYNNKNDKEV